MIRQVAPLQGVQYLRALAVMLVVLHHNMGGSGDMTALLPKIPFGASGVDIFFVISGLVISLSIAGRKTDPVRFILRRLIRIGPMYWLCTTALMAMIVGLDLFDDTTPSPGSFVKSMLFVPHYHVDYPEKIYPLLAQGWTLNYEMFFYTVMAVCIAISRHPLRALLAIMVSFVFIGAFVSTRNPLIITYTKPLLLEFCAGILICGVVFSGRVISTRWAILLPIGLAVLFTSDLFFHSTSRVIGWGLPAAMIVLGMVALDVNGRVPYWRFVKLVGDASYSIYLTHIFARSGSRLVWRHVMDTPAGLAEAIALVVFSIIVTLIVGIAVHLILEKPVLRLFNGLLERG